MPTPVKYNGPKITHAMTTTGFSLEGYTTVQTLGVVMGVTVRSRSVVGNVMAGFQVFFGGRITQFVELCERARQEAFELMIEHAEQTGGNAIIGIRYDANEIMSGVTEVLCYGTAVTVEPIN